MAGTRRRRRAVRALAIGAVAVAVNAPMVTATARERIDDARVHDPAYVARYGVWRTVGDSHTRAVHAAVLNTGRVLLVEGSGNDRRTFDKGSFSSVVWDPVANTFTKVPTPVDFFCGGHAFLPDGRLLVAGGTRTYEVLADKSPDGQKHEFQGLADAAIFDPQTQRYTKVSSMAHSRWYPTLVALASGAVVAVAGLDEKGLVDQGHTEVFDPATETWSERADLHRVWPTYPAMTLTQDGRLFYSGANAGYGSLDDGRTPGLWNLDDNSFQTVPGLPDPTMTETSMSVLLPPAQAQKVAIFGGGAVGDAPTATARTAVVDLTAPTPVWTAGPDLAEAKRYPGTVILPDDTVLVTGGSRGYRGNDSHTAQIFHPDTNTFTDAADPRIGRDYHAEAVLLPDGRVATFGSNPLKGNAFETRVEVYSPPYLFRGARPVVTQAPDRIAPGAAADLAVDQAVTAVRLVRPSAVTHLTDSEQRSVAAVIETHDDGQVRIRVPADPNLAPKGWYMLFALNALGVPSVAQWVYIG